MGPNRRQMPPPGRAAGAMSRPRMAARPAARVVERTNPMYSMLRSLISFIFWMPFDAVRGIRRVWILHRALRRAPCPGSLYDTSVRVRMGTDKVEFDDCDDQDCGVGAWCSMILFLRDPYLELAEPTWYKIENEQGRCLVHARRFPDGRYEMLRVPS